MTTNDIISKPGELSGGAVAESARIPLGELETRTGDLDRESLLVVRC